MRLISAKIYKFACIILTLFVLIFLSHSQANAVTNPADLFSVPDTWQPAQYSDGEPLIHEFELAGNTYNAIIYSRLDGVNLRFIPIVGKVIDDTGNVSYIFGDELSAVLQYSMMSFWTNDYLNPATSRIETWENLGETLAQKAIESDPGQVDPGIYLLAGGKALATIGFSSLIGPMPVGQVSTLDQISHAIHFGLFLTDLYSNLFNSHPNNNELLAAIRATHLTSYNSMDSTLFTKENTSNYISRGVDLIQNGMSITSDGLSVLGYLIETDDATINAIGTSIDSVFNGDTSLGNAISFQFICGISLNSSDLDPTCHFENYHRPIFSLNTLTPFTDKSLL